MCLLDCLLFHYLFLDWFILTGLIHDLGKVMAVWDEPQVMKPGYQTFGVPHTFVYILFEVVVTH